MTNIHTPTTVLNRLIEAGPATKISFSLHDIETHHAVEVIKAFPGAEIHAYSAGDRDHIAVRVAPDISISLFLKERSNRPVSSTPVADRILAEAGR